MFFFRLKEKQVEVKPEVASPSTKAVIDKADAGQQVAVAKKTLWQRFVDECKHYYSGFKLLFLDVRVSSAIVWKILNGHNLSRRESKQVVPTFFQNDIVLCSYYIELINCQMLSKSSLQR